MWMGVRTLVWFRGKDLRLRDNEALSEALVCGDVVTIHVLDPSEYSSQSVAQARHRVAHRLGALEELATNLAQRGGRLVTLHGAAEDVLPRFVVKHGIDQVFALRAGSPGDRAVASRLERNLATPFRQFDGQTLFPPERIRNGAGEPYRVFTPFAKAAKRCLELRRPLPVPRRLPPPPETVLSTDQGLPRVLDLPRVDAGERRALARLRSFVGGPIADYEGGRDQLGVTATSRLSADLACGALSPRQVVYAVMASAPASASRDRFIDQLLWREFAYSTLWDRPELLNAPFQRKFVGFPWRDDGKTFERWARGLTGYPIVDAAARQLLVEGFVHNRARMIAASFLSKDLLVDFRKGERHYLRLLVDADVAINDLGWQWSSGTGCDAQPYYRVFNPVTQGRKFDPDGNYVRKYVPELARLPTRYLHAPWEASNVELAEAGIKLGKEYPSPIVLQSGSRRRFLAIAAEFFAKKSD
jgi:deoxyribodipyrimidine photo-lyase